jgi:hypothetical protein
MSVQSASVLRLRYFEAVFAANIYPQRKTAGLPCAARKD